MRFTCNYALLRFLPYPDADEFVNLGVAVHCAQRRFLGIRLQTGGRRVLEFFPGLDRAAFEGAREAISAELERVQKLITEELDNALGRRVFRELVRPRESVFRFGEIRTILTGELETVADHLFAQYVDRHVAKQLGRQRH